MALSLSLLTLLGTRKVPSWVLEPFDKYRLEKHVRAEPRGSSMRLYYLRQLREARGPGPHLLSLPACAAASWLVTFAIGLGVVIATRESTGGHFAAVHMFLFPITVTKSQTEGAVQRATAAPTLLLRLRMHVRLPRQPCCCAFAAVHSSSPPSHDSLSPAGFSGFFAGVVRVQRGDDREEAEP